MPTGTGTRSFTSPAGAAPKMHVGKQRRPHSGHTSGRRSLEQALDPLRHASARIPGLAKRTAMNSNKKFHT